MNEASRCWWLPAAALLTCSPIAAEEPPPPCPLIPAMSQLADACRRDPVPEYCPWVFLVESLATGDDPCSLPLAPDLGLPPKADLANYALAGTLASFLMETDCGKQRNDWLLEFLESRFGKMEKAETVEMSFIFSFENPELQPMFTVASAHVDSQNRPALESAARGYRDLLALLGIPSMPTEAVRYSSNRSRQRGTSSILEPDNDLDGQDLQALRSVVDEFSAGRPERGRRDLEALCESRPPRLAARAGFVLWSYGFVEAAERVLRRGQNRLEAALRKTPEDRYLIVFIAWLRAKILMEMGFETEGKKLWATAGADQDPVVLALRQALDPPEARPAWRSERRLDIRSLTRAEAVARATGTQDSLSKSYRTIFPLPWGQFAPVGEAPLLILSQMVLSTEAGDLPGMEKSLDRLLTLYPHYHNLELLLPLARTFLRRDNRKDALRVIQRMCDLLEAQLATFQLDDTARTFMEAQVYGVYNFAVDAASWMAYGPDAFVFAERGRAFTLRRHLGQPTKSGGPSPSQEEQRLERTIRERESKGDREALVELREDFIRARLARQLAPGVSADDLSASPAPLSLAALQASLGEDEAILAYYEVFGRPNAPEKSRMQFLPELRSRRLWIWLVTRDQIRETRGSLQKEDWAALDCLALGLRWPDAPTAATDRGAHFLTACRGEEALADPASRLYELLVGPVASWLDSGSRLVVVPHGQLHDVPFAALRNPQTGRRLIEDYELAVAPSAAILAGLRSVD